MSDIGNRVKELRLSLGLTQEEFGEKIGLKKSGISNIENGTRNLSIRNIKLISKTFNVSELWLNSGVNGNTLKGWEESSIKEKLQEKVNTIEQIQNAFGSDYVNILESFDELNSKGKQKAIEVVDDLTLIPKYKKESPNDDSQNTK